MRQVLAVDFGGTKTALALVDESGAATGKQKLPAARTMDASLEQIAEYHAGSDVEAVGIVVPGIFDQSTGEAWAPNLWGQDRVPLREAAARRLGVPVVISSDRSGYVLGEQWAGVAKGLEDVVFVAAGTGIGVGILAGGRLVEGARGIAGAAGWMVIGGGWKEEYTSAGGWESEAAGPGVARRAGMASAEAVASAARAGDEGASEVMRQTADSLALGVANLISVLNPTMVVLGGGLMQAADLLFERIRRNALRWTQPVAAQTTRIEMTMLGEDAGLLGAARLAWMELGERSLTVAARKKKSGSEKEKSGSEEEIAALKES
jgi:glucokinase